MFATSVAYNGNLGGLAGADSKCAARASAAFLGGRWKAVLSDDYVRGSDHLKVSGVVYNTRPSGSGGPQIVASGSGTFWSSSHSNPTNFNESGGTVGNNIWTGTQNDGSSIAGFTCSNWTVSSGNAAFGSSTGTGTSWSNSSSTSCATTYPILCIDAQDPTPNSATGFTVTPANNASMTLQWRVNSFNSDYFDDVGFRIYRSTNNSTFTIVATTSANASSFTDSGLVNGTTYYYKVSAINIVSGTTYESVQTASVSAVASTNIHRIFATSTTYNGILGGQAGADAKCATRATAAGLNSTWKALISNEFVRASNHVAVNGPVYNMRLGTAGGPQVVAANNAGFWSSTHSNPINFNEFGDTVSNNIWTGTQNDGSIIGGFTCSNWTVSSGNAAFGSSTGTGTSWSNSSSTSCATTYPILCIDAQDPTPNSATGFTVTPANNASMTLQWRVNSFNSDYFDDVGFRIYRSTNNSTFTIVATTSANASSFTDSGLVNGTTYYYKVSAINIVSGTTYESVQTASVSAVASTNIHRIFATSTTYNGILGGQAGADAKCATRATAAGLNSTWKALISNEFVRASNHVAVNGPVYNMRLGTAGGPQVVAANNAGFWSSTHSNPINFNEFGDTVSNNIWTGTQNDGSIIGGFTCSNWTVSSGNAAFGSSTGTGTSWSNSSSTSCATTYPILCIDAQDPTPNPATGFTVSPANNVSMDLQWRVNSNNSDTFDDVGFRIYRSTNGSTYTLIATTTQYASTYTDTGLTNGSTYWYKVAAINTVSATTFESVHTAAASAVASTTVHRIFATSSAHTGNLGGLSGGDSICQTRANEAALGGTWKAVLSSSATNASSRITIGGPVYNLRLGSAGGRQIVATNSGTFWSTSHTNPIDFAETGATVGAAVFTGTDTSGTKVTSQNCTDWTLGSGGSHAYGSSTSTSSNWIWTSNNTCGTSSRIYCIDVQ